MKPASCACWAGVGWRTVAGRQVVSAGSGLRVRLFGPVEFEIHGSTATMSGVRMSVLVVRLAVDAGRVVSLEQLVDSVWGEEPPKTVRSSIQVHVSQLRRTLRDIGLDDVVVSRPPGYLLDVEHDAVDIHRFQQLATAAGGCFERGDFEAVLRIAHEALALWRGPRLARCSLRRRGPLWRWHCRRAGPS